MELESFCLIFPYRRSNGNAISALIAATEIHPILRDIDIYLPNFNKDPEELDIDFSGYDKVMLGFSVFSSQLIQVQEKISQYRNFFSDKDLLIIAGGPHAIGQPISLLQRGADIVCIGEGEVVITQTIMNFIQDLSYDSIKGIAYIKNEKIVKTARPKPVDLDEFPPFSLKYGLPRPIEITRGCAWKCRFCQIRNTGSPVRHRSISLILKYVAETKNYFNERRPDIRFVSPNALSYGSLDGKEVNLNKVEELLSGIREIIGEEGKIYFGSFPSEVRPETITPESVALLKKYGNSEKIAIGGQSGSDKILELIDRGHSVEGTERAVKLLIENGFKVDVDIIFGLPEENAEDVVLTIDHMRTMGDMGANIHSHTFMPLVGTPFANSHPGVIDEKYKPTIQELQQNRKLSGFHVKQERLAREMSERRKEDRE